MSCRQFEWTDLRKNILETISRLILEPINQGFIEYLGGRIGNEYSRILPRWCFLVCMHTQKNVIQETLGGETLEDTLPASY